MRFSAALIVAAAFGIAQAFDVPGGMEDGLWTTDGEGGWEKVDAPSDPSSSKMARSAKLSRGVTVQLPKGQTGCTTNGLDFSDLATAQYQMENYCGDTGADVPSKKHLVYTSGGAAAYVCNYGGKNSCNAAEARAAYAVIGGSCGTLSAPLGGWYWLSDWAKTYGYDAAGQGICTNGA